MYDELVNALRRLSDWSIMDYEDNLSYANQIVGEAADAIEELSKPRWIHVAERLPEKRKYVLVRYKNNDMAVACWFDGDEDILFWRAMTDEGWCADCDTDPTHWMPLPEPPKVEV